jgi:hypothetical protein
MNKRDATQAKHRSATRRRTNSENNCMNLRTGLRIFANTSKDCALRLTTSRRYSPPTPQARTREGEPFERILGDVDHIIVPGMVHWSHPMFLGYFGWTSTAPGFWAKF